MHAAERYSAGEHRAAGSCTSKHEAEYNTLASVSLVLCWQVLAEQQSAIPDLP